MRIRRSLTTPVSATTDSENDAALTSSDPADAFFTTPRRCSTTTASANSSSSSLVCVLNQSPWDVADPSSQLEGGLFSLTGTSFVPELAKISQSSPASSVKLSVDNDNSKQKQLDEGVQFDKLKYDKYSERGRNSVILNSSEGKIRAEKNNGSAALSSKSQIKSSSGKKPQQKQSTDHSTPQPGMKRRGRPTKKPSSNPDEFYYYSGFGPHWGKKRDTIHKQPTPLRTAKTEELCSSEAYSPDRSMAEDDKRNDIEFVDYDDDDDDDENEDGRRPSVRKKVKARSLKSLM